MDILADTRVRMEKWRGHWRRLSEQSRVPYDTVCKVGQGVHKNPLVNTVSALHSTLVVWGDPPFAPGANDADPEDGGAIVAATPSESSELQPTDGTA